MLGRVTEVQDEIMQLMHDKELKTVVASMKAESRARFDDVVSIVQRKEFWQKCKALLELSAPAMNILRMADSDIPGTQARCIMLAEGGMRRLFQRLRVSARLVSTRAHPLQGSQQAGPGDR